MGQVGFKLALFEFKLESSWHAEAILPSSCHHGPSWPHLGGNLEAIRPNLSRQKGFLGSKPLRRGRGSAEWRRPVEDEVFEEEESARVCKVIQHATATLTTSGGGGFSPQSGAPAPPERDILHATGYVRKFALFLGSLGRLGGVLEPLGGILEGSWARLGASGGHKMRPRWS